VVRVKYGATGLAAVSHGKILVARPPVGTAVARPGLLLTVLECAAAKVAANRTDSSGTLRLVRVRKRCQRIVLTTFAPYAIAYTV
jgi:hypothetical protein